MQVKRLIKTLIALKQFDLEQIAAHIKPERDRIAYNEKKKRAIEEHFTRVHQEISEIRARLTPPKDVDLEAERLNFIMNNVQNMLTAEMDGFQYDTIKMELDPKVPKIVISLLFSVWTCFFLLCVYFCQFQKLFLNFSYC